MRLILAGLVSFAVLGAFPDLAAALQDPTSLSSIRDAQVGGNLFDRVRSGFGMLVLLGIAWLMSGARSRISWRLVGWGLALQLIFAVFILKTRAGVLIFEGLNAAVLALLGYTEEGARFIFGNLVQNNIPVGSGSPGNDPMAPVVGQVAETGAFFAFNVLPTIIFFSSLMTVLYHLGVMQWCVRIFASVMQRTMKTSGAETLNAAGNIFVGQTEAPLLVKPFIAGMTQSELMAVMTGGFATVAGGVLAAYVGMLVFAFPDIAGHLMAASVMSAPAALVMAKLVVPETEASQTAGTMRVEVERPDVNVIEAAARGAAEGLTLALNVGAMLLAFVALVALADGMLGWVGGLLGAQDLSISLLLGYLLAPLAWVMGVPWVDAVQVGGLMGVKTVLNEFLAYLQLASAVGGESPLQPRSALIAVYALSGFANFSSIAIQIGGIGGIAPSRKSDLAKLGLRAMIAGSLAAFMTACVAGMLL